MAVEQVEHKLTYNITIATAGTPVSLASGIPESAGISDGTIIDLDVIGVEGNAGAVYIGYPGVDASEKIGIPITEGGNYYRDSQERRYRVWGAKLSELYVDAEQNNDKVSIVARVVVEEEE